MTIILMYVKLYQNILIIEDDDNKIHVQYNTIQYNTISFI